MHLIMLCSTLYGGDLRPSAAQPQVAYTLEGSVYAGFMKSAAYR